MTTCEPAGFISQTRRPQSGHKRAFAAQGVVVSLEKNGLLDPFGLYAEGAKQGSQHQ
jgi:hypothetical protein